MIRIRNRRTALRHHAALAGALLLVMSGVQALGQTGSLTVHVDRPGVRISPMLYGLMTEEINHSYDGGLYAELIRNRNFKADRGQPVAWRLCEGSSGAIALDETQPINEALTTCLKLTTQPGARCGAANSGYWGIPVKPNTTYRASFFAKAADGFAGPVTVAIESEIGSVTYATAQVAGITGEWKQYTTVLKTGSTRPTTTNRFALWAKGPGTVYLNQVSLFPPTFNNRPNGHRPDLMKLMGDMKPAFLRFPGGNYLEGNRISERFDWKATLGPISQRPGHPCPWGYPSTDGMGLLEFLHWCRDLKMEPILCVFAGYALQGEYIPVGAQLQPHVQDALDEIEYLTGGPETTWGARRIKDGEKEPFKLTYVEIGNEDWFDRSGSYDGRFAQFYDAIKAKYPSLQLIATAPVKQRKADVIDDHYYRSARDMAADANHYDRYDRSGPTIFVGEWASTEGSPTPTLQAALGDAAWLTGLERNSDLVKISCYAPLLVNVHPEARQWGTNLIGYDSLYSFGSPSYYVQKLFSLNRGDVVLPVTVTPVKTPAPAAFVPKGRVGVGSWLTQAEYRDAKVTVSGPKGAVSFDAGAFKPDHGDWKATDGVLRQTGMETDCRATAGNTSWTDYTYEVKARKLGGAEGFLILFHVEDRDNYIWWNIGGWGNTRTVIERAANGAKREIGRASDVTVETGRWYDIRIEVQGTTIRCFLDGKLVSEATDAPPRPIDPLYSTASLDEASGDVIIKVVNVSATPQPLSVTLDGVAAIAGGTMQQMKGSPQDVNTIAEPQKVAPRSRTVPSSGSRFDQSFPPHSVTVLRLKTK